MASQKEAEAAEAAGTTVTTAAPTTSQNKQQYQQSKEQQKKERKLTRQADALEEQLTVLSDQKDALETQMSQPDVFSDIEKLTKLQDQLNDVNAEIETTEDQWEEISMTLEELQG